MSGAHGRPSRVRCSHHFILPLNSSACDNPYCHHHNSESTGKGDGCPSRRHGFPCSPARHGEVEGDTSPVVTCVSVDRCAQRHQLVSVCSSLPFFPFSPRWTSSGGPGTWTGTRLARHLEQMRISLGRSWVGPELVTSEGGGLGSAQSRR